MVRGVASQEPLVRMQLLGGDSRRDALGNDASGFELRITISSIDDAGYPVAGCPASHEQAWYRGGELEVALRMETVVA